jgi:peptidoglycan/xylan/chitin deacetylase (PgdA/CDA1 family)
MKIIMFHSVRPSWIKYLPYSNYYNISTFKNFLDLNLDNIINFSPESFFFDYTDKNFKNKILLTFDDGLSEHFHYVYPELKMRNITAIFFIPTKPLVDGEILMIHNIHLLSGYLGYKGLMKEFFDLSLPSDISKLLFKVDPRATQAYPYDPQLIADFKYAINYLMPSSVVNHYLKIILGKYPAIKKISLRYYLTPAQIIEMSKGGMKFGMHGHTHKVFSSLSDAELISEVESSKKVFKEYISTPIECISYPFGDESAITMNNIAVLKKSGLKYGFMAETNFNKNKLASASNMKINRIDCKEI